MTLGQKLKQARQDRGLTQSQVCGQVITRNMLSQLENDQASPSVKTLEHLAAALGVTVGWLLEDDPVRETLAQARKAFEQGEFRSCLELLRDRPAGEEEEGKYLLIRAAICLGEEAAANGRYREAGEAAALAETRRPESLYAGKLEKLRTDALLLRCAIAMGDGAEEAARAVRRNLTVLDFTEESRLLMARYALSQDQLQTAAQELLAIGEPSPQARGEWLILMGIGEMAQKNWQKAEKSLRRAEAAPVLTKVQRRELYRLLERCCKERQDYEQAYYYASRQLQLEQSED